ncbi:MAG: PorT family protein [Chitinophagaceae bacterium]|nr:MAG: PorT family protein [Chitinophagaceae bacterium]
MNRRITIIACMCMLSLAALAQDKAKKGFGLKAGLNFINVKNVRSISDANSTSKTGFMAGLYWAPPAAGVIGYRSELIYSRQGYDFKTTSATGTMMMDYVMLPQLMTVNISKYFQLQAGGQISLLVRAKADSVSSSSAPATPKNAMDYYNKLNYGAAGGVEIKPIAGLIIGGRYNAFFGSLNEQVSSGTTPGLPAFIPKDGKKLKNGLIQLYIGYQF